VAGPGGGAGEGGQLAARAQLGLWIRPWIRLGHAAGLAIGLAIGLRIRPGDGDGLGPVGAGVVAPQEREGGGDRDRAGQAGQPAGDDRDPHRAGQRRGQAGLEVAERLPGWLAFLISDSAP
jgi:hypothetical protein